MNSSGKILLWVLVLFAIILGGSFVLSRLETKDQGQERDTGLRARSESTEENSSGSKTASGGAARDFDMGTNTNEPSNITHFKNALREEDEAECHHITSADLRTECFDRVRLASALAIEEIDLCTLISAAQTKTYCLDTLLHREAVGTKNPNLCLQLSSATRQQECARETDAVLFSGALNSSDCENIQNGEQKKSCVDNFRLRDLATASGSTVCNEFLTLEGVEKCQNYFWNRTALEQKDPTMCLKIVGTEEQQNCEEAMKMLLKQEGHTQEILEGKSTSCAAFLDVELKRECENAAHYYAARIHRDTKYCANIEGNAALQNRCSQELTVINDEYWLAKAKTEDQAAHCDRISTPSGAEYCRAVL